MQRLWIPGRVPGLNEILDARASFGHVVNASGKRYNAYSALKKQWGARVKLCANIARIKSIESAYFTYLFRERDKRRDPSNFCAGGAKIIEDALKEAGIIRNDGWSVVEGIAHYWLVDKPLEGVTLFLTQRLPLDRADAIWRDDNERRKHG